MSGWTRDARGRNNARKDKNDQGRHDEEGFPPTGKKGSGQKSSVKSTILHEPSDSSDSDEEIQPIHFFVPGENINAAILVEYFTRFVDRTAKITSARHPTDKTRVGFSILAKKALNAVNIRDLINDSRNWDLETKGREYRRDPYDYRASDTAKRRAEKGPSEGGIGCPQQPSMKRPQNVPEEPTTTSYSYGRPSQAQQPQSNSYRSLATPPTNSYTSQSSSYISQSDSYTGQSNSYTSPATSQGPAGPGATSAASPVNPYSCTVPATSRGPAGPGATNAVNPVNNYPSAYPTSRGTPHRLASEAYDAQKPVTSRGRSTQPQYDTLPPDPAPGSDLDARFRRLRPAAVA